MLSPKTFALPLAILLTVASAGRPASAITVELAKKCREMALREHPTTAIGSKNSSAKAQQDYYKACIEKNGKMD